jgi:peptidoglycan/xylan/chitin deacetylase (PgdA/CDA1 family)
VLLGVSFHYVARERPRVPVAIFPVAVDEFAAQLDELGRMFEFVSRDAIVAAVSHGAPLPERACAITFDDGLRQQFDLALPVLEDRGIPGIFFVSGAPLAERRVAYVHKIHLLREALGDDALRVAVEGELRARGIDWDDLWPTEPVAMYPYDSPDVARLKHVLNFALGAHRSEAIDAVFATAFAEHAVAEELYMPPEQVVELEQRGALGAHGFHHVPLATLGRSAAIADLRRSRDALEAITGSAPRMMSYPYGTADAVDSSVAAAAGEAGFEVSFTMERAVNITLDHPLLLGRIDTRDAPGGSEPRLQIANEAVEVESPLTYGRRRYASEQAA